LGVDQIIPLPDGPVIGRWDLAALSRRAAAAADSAMRGAVIQALAEEGEQPSSALGATVR
jgi:hypothetical protein